MSTASIKKPLIIKSDKSAKILADILDSKKEPQNSETPPANVTVTSGSTIISFLRTAK